MNINEPEPITGPGLLWAIGQINKQFERAATKPVPERKEEEAEALRANPEPQ